MALYAKDAIRLSVSAAQPGHLSRYPAGVVGGGGVVVVPVDVGVCGVVVATGTVPVLARTSVSVWPVVAGVVVVAGDCFETAMRRITNREPSALLRRVREWPLSRVTFAPPFVNEPVMSEN